MGGVLQKGVFLGAGRQVEGLLAESAAQGRTCKGFVWAPKTENDSCPNELPVSCSPMQGSSIPSGASSHSSAFAPPHATSPSALNTGYRYRARPLLPVVMGGWSSAMGHGLGRTKGLQHLFVKKALQVQFGRTHCGLHMFTHHLF